MSATATTTAAVTVSVNDQPHGIGAGATLAGLIHELGFGDRKGIAVAVSGAVAPKSTWPTHALQHGDRVLLIKATQGG